MDEATEVIPESGNFAEYPEGVNVEYVDTVGKTLNDKRQVFFICSNRRFQQGVGCSIPCLVCSAQFEV